MDANDRTPEQNQLYQYYKLETIDPVIKDFENGVVIIEQHNKDQVRMELEAYSKQLSKYGAKMSLDNLAEAEKMYSTYKNLWENLRNQ